MIYITQLIYLNDGQERVFEQFEAIAIPLISKYNGQLLLRLRPSNESFVQSSVDHPYEIHLIEFQTENDFQQFIKDEERNKYLYLKDQSVRDVRLFIGSSI